MSDGEHRLALVKQAAVILLEADEWLPRRGLFPGTPMGEVWMGKLLRNLKAGGVILFAHEGRTPSQMYCANIQDEGCEPALRAISEGNPEVIALYAQGCGIEVHHHLPIAVAPSEDSELTPDQPPDPLEQMVAVLERMSARLDAIEERLSSHVPTTLGEPATTIDGVPLHETPAGFVVDARSDDHAAVLEAMLTRVVVAAAESIDQRMRERIDQLPVTGDRVIRDFSDQVNDGLNRFLASLQERDAKWGSSLARAQQAFADGSSKHVDILETYAEHFAQELGKVLRERFPDAKNGRSSMLAALVPGAKPSVLK